MECIRNLDVN